MLRPNTHARYQERLQRVLSHIEANLDAALTPAALAGIAGFSLHHFHRIFRGVTGEAMESYVRRLRLERAARRLRTGSTEILSVALEAGYSSHEAFTRAFQGHFGCVPSVWRGAVAPPVVLLAPPEVAVRRYPAVSGVALRHVGPWGELGPLYARLFAVAAQAGLGWEDGPVFGLCVDDPDITAPAQLRFDAFLPLGAPCFASQVYPAVPGQIPAGRYAVTVHTGPFSTISSTYAAFFGGWIAATEHQLADEPCIECYLDDPNTTPPAQLRTEIRVRLLD